MRRDPQPVFSGEAEAGEEVSFTRQKFLALGALGLVFGFIAGWFGIPYFAESLESDIIHDVEFSVNGTTVFKCGELWFPQATFGGIVGAGFGLVLGLALAWWLPTPKDERSKALN